LISLGFVTQFALNFWLTCADWFRVFHWRKSSRFENGLVPRERVAN
jgi:hypothetical protein